ncbi:hypothetical protein GYA49_02670 [Candidatus Beckwithbacteria bacterium]|nr:hypothetical protein [Candidatus Beckwithbacteria bacterium]
MLKKIKRIFYLSKRRKFVISATILSFGLLFIQEIQGIYHYGAIAGLSLITVLLSIWSLKEDIRKIGWVMALILPTFFTASINLFYFLLPERLVIRLAFMALFGIGMYALLLTENIFTVAALRTIQLLRAAQALGFVLTLFVAFLLYDTIFSYKLEPWYNAGLVLLASFPLVLQGVWSAKLEDKLSKKTLSYSLILTFILGQMAMIISMWPVTIIIASLFLVTVFYVILGIIQQALVGRLFRQTAFEYLRVGIAVLLIVLFIARWRG